MRRGAGRMTGAVLHGALVAALMAGSPAGARDALTPRQTHALTRWETALAAQPSATKVLQGWCDAHFPAHHLKIWAAPRESGSPMPPGLRTALGVGPDEPLGTRHITLICGWVPLSEADNWFVQSRLTPAMRTALAQTETPFGTVAAPLHFTREPLSSRRGPAEGCNRRTVLANRALLRLPSGEPLALVRECYQPNVLAPAGQVFGPPVLEPVPPVVVPLPLPQVVLPVASR